MLATPTDGIDKYSDVSLSPVLGGAVGVVCCAVGGGTIAEDLTPGGGGSREPPIGRDFPAAPPDSFFFMF